MEGRPPARDEARGNPTEDGNLPHFDHGDSSMGVNVCTHFPVCSQ